MGTENFSEKSARVLDASNQTLNTVLASEAQYASLFYEDTIRREISHRATPATTSRQIKRREKVIEGLGVYAFSPTKKAHDFSKDLEQGLDVARRVGRCIGGQRTGRHTQPFKLRAHIDLPNDAPEYISKTEIDVLIEALVDAIYSVGDDVRMSEVTYQDATRRTLLVDSEGTGVSQAQCWIGVNLRVAVRGPRGEATGMVSWGKNGGFGKLAFSDIENMARNAVERAWRRRDARPVRAGTMPVVFDGGGAGLWLHEALGHRLESDVSTEEIRSKLGKKLTADEMNVVDDATMNEGQGALDYDDEGVAGQRTSLIENGYLCALMTDKHEVFQRGLPASGNGRRQDFHYPPLPRMTNLCLLPGVATQDDMIASIANGIYVTQIETGVAHVDRGVLELQVRDGYRIEQGRLTHPVDNLQIRTEYLHVFQHIRGVGSDARLSETTGKCVKAGQVVPVSVSSPSVLIDSLQVY